MLSKPQGLVRPEGLGKFKIHLFGYQTRDVPVCSLVPYPLRYRVPHSDSLDGWGPSNTFPRLRYFFCPEVGGETFLRNVDL
jgi:hypothetical protein